MYFSDSSILELFGRFTTVCTVYCSALKYIFIWASICSLALNYLGNTSDLELNHFVFCLPCSRAATMCS